MLFERGVTESVSVSDNVEWFQKRGIEGVIKEIRSAQKRGKYYYAISLACSYFQYRGKQLLGYRLDKRINLIEIIRQLRKKGLVDRAICEEMDKIRDLARNGLQHNGAAFEFSSRQIMLQRDLAVIALNCLESFRKMSGR